MRGVSIKIPTRETTRTQMTGYVAWSDTSLTSHCALRAHAYMGTVEIEHFAPSQHMHQETLLTLVVLVFLLQVLYPRKNSLTYTLVNLHSTTPTGGAGTTYPTIGEQQGRESHVHVCVMCLTFQPLLPYWHNSTIKHELWCFNIRNFNTRNCVAYQLLSFLTANNNECLLANAKGSNHCCC